MRRTTPIRSQAHAAALGILVSAALVAGGCPDPTSLDPARSATDDTNPGSAEPLAPTVAGTWAEQFDRGNVLTFDPDGRLEYLAMPGIGALQRAGHTLGESLQDCEILFAADGLNAGQEDRVLQYLCTGADNRGIGNMYMHLDGAMSLDPDSLRVTYHEVSSTRIAIEVTASGQNAVLEFIADVNVTFVGQMSADGRSIRWLSASGTINHEVDSSYGGVPSRRQTTRVTDDNWRLHYELPDFRRAA